MSSHQPRKWQLYHLRPCASIPARSDHLLGRCPRINPYIAQNTKTQHRASSKITDNTCSSQHFLFGVQLSRAIYSAKHQNPAQNKCKTNRYKHLFGVQRNCIVSTAPLRTFPQIQNPSPPLLTPLAFLIAFHPSGYTIVYVKFS
jgi:hypothetical protein